MATAKLDWVPIFRKEENHTLLSHVKREAESLTQSIRSLDETTGSSEYGKDFLQALEFSKQNLQGVESFEEKTVYTHTLETLISEIKELKHALQQSTKPHPAIVQAKIYNLPSEEYELTTPLNIVIEIHTNEVIAIFPDLELYGEGVNQIEAVNELKLELLDLYEDIEDIEDENLGDSPRAWKKTLQQLVKRCQ